jgi:long-chain fatty acid transport protein
MKLRFRFHRVTAPLAVLAFLVAAPAYPAGFQVMTQDAKAMGMGLAFTAVADDPSAIFFNPAGLGWQKHFEAEIGASFLTKVKGDFDGANPYPGIGITEDQHKTTFVLPTLYVVVPLTNELNFGLGIFSPYGLGYRWDNAENCGGDCATNPVNGAASFSGRFISQNAVIQTADINPVFSYQLTPSFALAVGADYRMSKVQLEKNQAGVNPFTQSVVDVAHVKLNSDLTSNHGWGWNAGLMFKPTPEFSIGASYRSKITIDYEGTAQFQQRFTGNPAFDAAVRAQLPQGDHPVTTSIAFPATYNLGVAYGLPANFQVSIEADRTLWSSFSALDIHFPDLTGLDLHRQTDWKDVWAYRIGLAKSFGNASLRLGYYRDKTPQPREDVGPLLADNDRDAFTIGFGWGTDRWGVDISDEYLKVQNADVSNVAVHDGFYGTYHESVNIFALSFRFAF